MIAGPRWAGQILRLVVMLFFEADCNLLASWSITKV
jgi:hypothetical protein